MICKNANKCIHTVEFINKDNKICKVDLLGSNICNLVKKNSSVDTLDSYLYDHFYNNGFIDNINLKKFINFKLINISKNKYIITLSKDLKDVYMKEIIIFNNSKKIETGDIKSLTIKYKNKILIKWYGNALKRNQKFIIDLLLKNYYIEIECEKSINNLYLELSYFKDVVYNNKTLEVLYQDNLLNEIDINFYGKYNDIRFCLVNKVTKLKNSLSIIDSFHIVNITDLIPIQLLDFDNGLAIYKFNYEFKNYFTYYGSTQFCLKIKEDKNFCYKNYRLEIYANKII